MAEQVTQSNYTVDADAVLAYNEPGIAQGFQVSITSNVTRFTVQMKKIAGTPDGTLTGYIYDNSANKPNAVLATFSSITAGALTTSYVTYNFTGSCAVSLSTQYHIGVYRTGGTTASWYINSYESGSVYADGARSYDIGAGWVAWVGDLWFEVYQNVVSTQARIIMVD